MSLRKIQTALISVYHKDGLEPLVKTLDKLGVKIISTGGTQLFLENLGIDVTAAEDLTGYPSVFGGRVKTLHPAIFGGILRRRDHENDNAEAEKHSISSIDLVIVNLYPFEETVASGADEAEVIEKIDIGGPSLIRAAAKNFNDVAVVADPADYAQLDHVLNKQKGELNLEQRRHFSAKAFDITSHYDTAIFNYFNVKENIPAFKQSIRQSQALRYGENPHQNAVFYGDLHEFAEQLSGKELSYNNLLDVDAAVSLMSEFKETAFAILKHTNACGVALGATVAEAYRKALAGDPVSAFGGILITNRKVDLEAAEAMHNLFFEVLIAPEFEQRAFALLSQKKSRRLLKLNNNSLPEKQFKTLLNGVVVQDRDAKTESQQDFKAVTDRKPTEEELKAMVFALKVIKHTKSNAIVLAGEGQLFASGTGQTSRVDALRQAVEKAQKFGFDLSKAVMASDAFFPFPDCVEIASAAGIKAVVQPGGSLKDQDSIDVCNANGTAMVLTGVRHFKH